MEHFQQRGTAVDFAAQQLREVFATSAYIKNTVGISVSDMLALGQAERLQALYRATPPRRRGGRSRSKRLWAERIIQTWHEGLAPDPPGSTSTTPYRTFLGLMMEGAKRDPSCFDALCLHGAQFIARDAKPELELREFIFDVLLRKRVRPRAGGRPKTAVARDRILHSVVLAVSWKFSIHPTRNDEAGHFDSACDIVAEALARDGIKPSSYSAVKRIWLKQEASA